ncbi:hypothetical protein QNI19_00575 [Cytophagaceae bacterium DM2B3-1]|uniref:Uncharacterized protein n=1 Tax=Xanthocytophaga flava TaxID=3048013 RepID=A0ABT7CCL1_9BACT|nr:hypothetical protein [Xanthocytophaga flavus]MDJ1470037.1 hypothetical protein [Xanthocytophaga flavus]MDJ1491399.1 hypothetical protein [Xanthocytophaga flavus]
MTFLKRLSSDKIIAIMATVISICALFTSVYQVKIERKQQYASMWPSLHIYSQTQMLPDSAQNFCGIRITNKGVGPAIIKKIEIWYRDQVCEDERDLIQKVTGGNMNEGEAINQIWEDRVLASNEEIEWIKVGGAINTRQFREALKTGYIHVRLEYASVYEERWEYNFNMGKKSIVKLSD